MSPEDRKKIASHPEIKNAYHYHRHKRPPRFAQMNASELGFEIDRLRAEISEQPINDSGAFRYKQKEAVKKLGEIREYLSVLLRHLPP